MAGSGVGEADGWTAAYEAPGECYDEGFEVMGFEVMGFEVVG